MRKLMLGEVSTGPKSYGLKVTEQKSQPRSHSIFKPLSTRDPTPESGRLTTVMSEHLCASPHWGRSSSCCFSSEDKDPAWSLQSAAGMHPPQSKANCPSLEASSHWPHHGSRQFVFLSKQEDLRTPPPTGVLALCQRTSPDDLLCTKPGPDYIKINKTV